jgi:hypothetical protein
MHAHTRLSHFNLHINIYVHHDHDVSELQSPIIFPFHRMYKKIKSKKESFNSVLFHN